MVGSRWNRWTLAFSRGVGTLVLIGALTGALAAQQVELVSRVDPSRPSVTPDGNSALSALSADGRYVVFTSTAINVVPEQKDTNGGTDVFLRDQVTGTTVLVSRASGSASSAGNAPASGAHISADGRYVLFRSKATNLVSGQVDPPGTSDLFLFDRVTEAMTLVSRSNASARQTGNADSLGEEMSANGRFVLFSSLATDLVKGQSDTNSGRDVFLFDRISNATLLVSHAAGSAVRTGDSDSDFVFPYSVSSDGTQLLFLTVLQGTGKGNLRIFPGNAKPSAKPSATLRFEKGQTRTASYTLPLATNGAGTLAIVPFVAGKGTVHAVVEVTGFQ